MSVSEQPHLKMTPSWSFAATFRAFPSQNGQFMTIPRLPQHGAWHGTLGPRHIAEDECVLTIETAEHPYVKQLRGIAT